MVVANYLPALFGTVAVIAALLGLIFPALLLAFLTYASQVILRRRSA